MAALYLVLVLVTAFDPGFSHVIGGEEKSVIKLPTEFHFKGDETNLLTGIIKPFEIWYNETANKARLDYYGGLVKHYYTGETDTAYGYEFFIHMESNEEDINQKVCQEKDHEGVAPSFMSPVKDYEFEGIETYNDKQVDVWTYYLFEEDDKTTNNMVYTYKNEEGLDIPVFWETKVSNLWTGALKEHVHTRFYDFKKPELKALDHSLDDACAGSSVSSDLPHISHDVNRAFTSYLDRHSKTYGVDEQVIRKEIFKKNWKRVMEHNRKNLSYKMTLNKFSDWTDEELANLRGTRPSEERVGSMPFPHSEDEVALLVQDLPKSYDMRNEGYISSVKNQASCGSCWAFSSTAAVEGALARSNGGRNVDLSEQSMVDCAWGFDASGCGGGTVVGAFKYILKHGLPSQMEYGLYLDEEGKCNTENMTEFFNIKGFAAVPPLSVDAMKVALYNYGPVTVSINANDAVSNYNNGIFFDPTCNSAPKNHGVTVVGYGEREGVVYWIVKNSWGEDWGEDGYILVSATDNNCHILEDAFYPIT